MTRSTTLIAILWLVALGACESRDHAGDDAGTRDAAVLPDADGDTISDHDESDGTVDTDMDGTPDTLDLDTDGDGIPDATEAGDSDVTTHPVDTDLDGTPDFRDLDSDGDGLPDANEIIDGTDPRDPDTDHDGVTDLVEHVAGTSGTDPTSSPATHGDFYFVEPYYAPPMPEKETLVFETSIHRADVFFMIDTSISMQVYIDRFRASLTTTIIPGIATAIPDVQFGVGQFDHCPQSTYDEPSPCVGIEVEQHSTPDTAAIGTALDGLTADCVNVAEPYAQTAWLWATGDTSMWPLAHPAGCAPGEIGYGCVRSDALPILVIIGDENFSESHRTGGWDCDGNMCTTCATFPTDADIISAFAAIHGRLVVLGPTGSSANWPPIVTATGAVDATGAPLIFPDVGTHRSVDAGIVTAIQQLAANTPLDVSARAHDLDTDGVDATQFIDHIELSTVGGVPDPRDATHVCVGGLPTSDTDGDGRPDTFPHVTPGTPVCFDIYPKENDTVMPTTAPQVFRAAVDVIGDGITVLDTRTVYFLVPPSSTVMLH